MTFLPLDHCLFEHEWSAGNWQDFTGSLVTCVLNLREFDGHNTAGLTLIDSILDPAQSSSSHVMKKGDTVRVHMNNASATSRKTGTFVIKKVSTTIDLKKPPGRQYLVNVQLRGKGVKALAGTGAAKGVDTIEELSDVITGAAFEIGGDGYGSGLTTPIGTSTEIAHTDVASEFDQVLITRDSNPGVLAFEDPEGTIQIFDADTQRTAAATFTLGPDKYSDIDMRFDTSHIVNVLTIKYLKKVRKRRKHTRIIEHDFRFVDTASRNKYGPFKRTHVVHKRIDFADYADKVFDHNADPDQVPMSVRVPIRRASELLGGYEDGNYVTKKVDVVSPDGLTTYVCRISRIQHTITSRRWFVDVFLKPPTVIRHRRRTVATEVAHNPSKSLQRESVDFPMQDKVDTVTAAGAGDLTFFTTYLPAAEAPHLRWNGQSQPATEFVRDGYQVTILDPDNFLTAGDDLEFQYFYTEETSIGDTDSAAASSPVASLDIPIGSHVDGDTILLAATRGTPPDGWSLLSTFGTLPTLAVYTKTGDGVETDVHLVASPNAVIAGVTVILAGAPDDLVVDDVDLPWSAGSTYAAPALVDAAAVLSVGVFDGPGDPPDEHITAVDTEFLVNVNAQTGLYGVAAARGQATFTATAGDSSGSHFLAVTIGVAT